MAMYNSPAEDAQSSSTAQSLDQLASVAAAAQAMAALATSQGVPAEATEEGRPKEGEKKSKKKYSKQNPYKSSVFDSRWESRYQELVAYREEHGDCLVPVRYDANPGLGRWVREQRHRNTKNKLSQERYERLMAIGFHFQHFATVRGRVNAPTELDPDSRWEQRFEELCEFKRVHGHCLVPDKFESNQSLGGWVQRQRHRNKYNKLPKERYDRLCSIGFRFDPVTKGRTSEGEMCESPEPLDTIEELEQDELPSSGQSSHRLVSHVDRQPQNNQHPEQNSSSPTLQQMDGDAGIPNLMNPQDPSTVAQSPQVLNLSGQATRATSHNCKLHPSQSEEIYAGTDSEMPICNTAEYWNSRYKRLMDKYRKRRNCLVLKVLEQNS